MYVRMYVSVYLYDTVMQCVVSNSVHVYVICTYVRTLILSITGIKSLYVNLPVGQGHAHDFVAKNVASKSYGKLHSISYMHAFTQCCPS